MDGDAGTLWGLLAEILSARFMPHAACMADRPGLVLLHALSDTAVALAYFAFPTMLVFLVVGRRRAGLGVPFPGAFLLVSSFIVLCGITHTLKVVVLWWPYYWIEGIGTFLTAVGSWATVAYVGTHLQDAPVLPDTRQLEREVAALRQENDALRKATGGGRE